MNYLLKSIGNAILITVAFKIADIFVGKALALSASVIAGTKESTTFSAEKNG